MIELTPEETAVVIAELQYMTIHRTAYHLSHPSWNAKAKIKQIESIIKKLKSKNDEN